MPPIQFGFELEVVSPLPQTTLAFFLRKGGFKTDVHNEMGFGDERHRYISGRHFNLSYDSSINPAYGFHDVEIRRGLFTIDDLDSFRPFFLLLNKWGVKTNPNCGLHIHASADEPLDAVALRELSRKEVCRVVPRRSKYCKWENSDDPHYEAVNQRSPTHVEFRWFSGSTNFQYFCKMIRLVDYYIQLFYLRSTQDSTVSTPCCAG